MLCHQVWCGHCGSKNTFLVCNEISEDHMIKYSRDLVERQLWLGGIQGKLPS